MKKLLIIDPFVKQPVNNCFNRLVDLLPAKLYLFQPAFFPLNLYTLPSVDGYILLGSASHVGEKLSWHQGLCDFLVTELKNHKPVLGLCFGHQILAHAFGAEVDFLHTNQDKIVGSRVINWGQDSYTLGITHRQAVKKLSAELVALTPQSVYGFDLIQHQTLPFIGCQAHPEASEQFLRSDCEIGDFSKREDILHSSTKFMLQWMNEAFK